MRSRPAEEGTAARRAAVRHHGLMRPGADRPASAAATRAAPPTRASAARPGSAAATSGGAPRPGTPCASRRRARLARAVRATDAAVRASLALRRTAVLTGAIFVIASTPKFFAYGWELDAFERFGLPAPGAMVLLAGVIELVGGGLLLAGRAVVPSAVVLAATMVVATVAGGVVGGDLIPSLTLAPALVAAMLGLAAGALTAVRRGGPVQRSS